MKFASVRVVTGQFDVLVAFYEKLTAVAATHLAPGFAELRLDGCTLAISSQDIINKVSPGVITPKANRSLMIELEVANVDELQALAAQLGAILQPPTTMPWGNRSMLLKDPDGAIVNIFSRAEK